MSGKIKLIQFFLYIVSFLGLLMYGLAIASNKDIQKALDTTIWIFTIIFTIFIFAGSTLAIL